MVQLGERCRWSCWVGCPQAWFCLISSDTVNQCSSAAWFLFMNLTCCFFHLNNFRSVLGKSRLPILSQSGGSCFISFPLSWVQEGCGVSSRILRACTGLSAKGQRGTLPGSVNPNVAAAQPYPSSTNATSSPCGVSGPMYMPIKLYLQTQDTGRSLLTSHVCCGSCPLCHVQKILPDPEVKRLFPHRRILS